MFSLLQEISPLTLLKFATDIAKGMIYLADGSFVHLELAAKNCRYLFDVLTVAFICPQTKQILYKILTFIWQTRFHPGGKNCWFWIGENEENWWHSSCQGRETSLVCFVHEPWMFPKQYIFNKKWCGKMFLFNQISSFQPFEKGQWQTKPKNTDWSINWTSMLSVDLIHGCAKTLPH